MNTSNKNKTATIVLVGVVIFAGTVALTRSRTPEPPTTPTVAAQPPAPNAPMLTATTEQLPPGHPAIPADHAATAGATTLPALPPPVAGVTWKAPERWELVPHESPMRIATYRIPHVAGDAEDAELSVTRAGGDTNANVDRWLGQFDEAGRKTAKRSELLVDGLHVIVVEVQGSYSGMGSPEPQPGFAMKSAIVETVGTKHFFKMTGPAKTVEAARAELQALVDSIRLVPPTTP